MDQLLGQLTGAIQHASETLDEKARRQTIDALRELQYSLETPEETMLRLVHMNTTLASIMTCLNLGLYNMLAEATEPLTLQQLAEKTKADPILLGRILRHQASLSMIKETAADTFTASRTTKNLSVPEIQSAFHFFNLVLDPATQAMPKFLAERGYQNPTNTFDTPFHKAWKTREEFWEWLHKRPEETTCFNAFMRGWKSSLKTCFEIWDLRKECLEWSAEKPVFLDIGGGTGHQCIALKQKHPGLPGQVILQDLPATVAEAQLPSDIDKMPYDFFKEQPVKGAKYYYFRGVLHDHSDARCREILRHQVEAMGPDSMLVIDDIVIPNVGVDWFTTQVDIAMLVQFSSMERTDAQWRTLLESVGLKVEKIECYTFNYRLSLIFAKRA